MSDSPEITSIQRGEMTENHFNYYRACLRPGFPVEVIRELYDFEKGIVRKLGRDLEIHLELCKYCQQIYDAKFKDFRGNEKPLPWSECPTGKLRCNCLLTRKIMADPRVVDVLFGYAEVIPREYEEHFESKCQVCIQPFKAAYEKHRRYRQLIRQSRLGILKVKSTKIYLKPI